MSDDLDDSGFDDGGLVEMDGKPYRRHHICTMFEGRFVLDVGLQSTMFDKLEVFVRKGATAVYGLLPPDLEPPDPPAVERA